MTKIERIYHGDALDVLKTGVSEIECDSCDGLGEIMTDDYATHTCVTCDGSGYVINDEGQATE